jgi:hypothetical protein
MSVMPSPDDFTPPGSDEGSDTAHVDAVTDPPSEPVQVSADDPDFDQALRNLPPEPTPTPDDPVIRARTPDDSPPLRSPDDDPPEDDLPETPRVQDEETPADTPAAAG